MPARRLAARSPIMPLARSRLRPATGPATEPVRARAAGARVGPAPTIPPAAGRSQRQPPHPPPLPPPLLAIPSPPRSSWHVQLLKPELLLCPQLDLVGESTLCGVGEFSCGVLRGQGSGQVERGDTRSCRFPGESGSESCCCSLQQQWQRPAMEPRRRDPSDPRPQSSGFLDGDSLLNAASTKLCGFHVTYGVPLGRPGNLPACAGPCGERDKGSWGGSGHVHYVFQHIIDHSS